MTKKQITGVGTPTVSPDVKKPKPYSKTYLAQLLAQYAASKGHPLANATMSKLSTSDIVAFISLASASRYREAAEGRSDKSSEVRGWISLSFLLVRFI